MTVLETVGPLPFGGGPAPYVPNAAAVPHRAAGYVPLLRRTEPPRAAITARQVAVLRLAANGNTNDQIGRILGISANTVNSTLRTAYLKLGASDRAQAVAVAIRMGLIRLEDIDLPGSAKETA